MKASPAPLPTPTDTHVVGFADQPLFIVQNVTDTANQLHGAAVICALKEDTGTTQWPPGSDHTGLLSVLTPSSPLSFSFSWGALGLSDTANSPLPLPSQNFLLGLQ